MERRKFMDQFFRWTLAGGLFSMGGILASRGQLTFSEDCSYLPACTHCDLFDGCEQTAKKKRLNHEKGHPEQGQ